MVAKAIDAAVPELVTKTVALVPRPVDGRDGRDDAAGIAGRDGVDGANGTDGAPGQKGADGLDGLGFDDMTFEHDGGRKGVLRFVRGDQAKEFAITIPCIIDRGVYASGATYEKGDATTYGGSLWIAQRDTDTSPPGDGWRLAVKRGRDGSKT